MTGIIMPIYGEVTTTTTTTTTPPPTPPPTTTTTTTTLPPTTPTTTTTTTTTPAPVLVYWYTGCCSGTQVTGTSTVGFTEAFNAMNAQCGTTVTNQQSGTYIGTPNIPTISCSTTTTTTTTTTAAPINFRQCTSFDVSIGCFSTSCCVIASCASGASCPSSNCSTAGWCT